jgi:glycosyltransferase involved in cell wall biosynthesis
LSVKPLPAFVNLFKKDSYNISRFISDEFNKKLINILAAESYDIVQLEGLYVSPYLDTIRKYSKAKVVLRSHNVEFVIWERLASSTKNPLKKIYLKFLAKRLKRYEISLLNSFDAIVPITETDLESFKKLACRIPIKAAPLGVDINEYSHDEKQNSEFSIFHLGSMDWMPNLEAVDWFLKNVYKKLTDQVHDIKIYLAGKDMPERIKNMAGKNLIVMDRISDSKKFMADKSVMIVPLLSGGGMRVKIIEGMASAKPIVSTAIGAEGIHFTDNKNILIADSPDDFVSAILKLKNDKVFCKSIGENARKLVEDEYDNKIIGKELLLFYQSLLENKKL